MPKSPSEMAIEIGLPGLNTVVAMTGASRQTLIRWHRNKHDLYHFVIMGCAREFNRENESMNGKRPVLNKTAFNDSHDRIFKPTTGKPKLWRYEIAFLKDGEIQTKFRESTGLTQALKSFMQSNIVAESAIRAVKRCGGTI